MRTPTFGTTQTGQPVHAHTRHYLGSLLSPREALKGVEGVNAKVAVLITSSVGTMACAYLFAVIALISLPAILIQANVIKQNDVPVFFTKPGLILIVAWIAQTFLQLVLLSIILVGQRVQSTASDARALKEFELTKSSADALDLKTEGGLAVIYKQNLDILDAVKPKTEDPSVHAGA
jgi:hypothetical protein